MDPSRRFEYNVKAALAYDSTKSCHDSAFHTTDGAIYDRPTSGYIMGKMLGEVGFSEPLNIQNYGFMSLVATIPFQRKQDKV